MSKIDKYNMGLDYLTKYDFKDKSKNLSPDHPLLPSTQPLPASFPFSLVL